MLKQLSVLLDGDFPVSYKILNGEMVEGEGIIFEGGDPQILVPLADK